MACDKQDNSYAKQVLWASHQSAITNLSKNLASQKEAGKPWDARFWNKW